MSRARLPSLFASVCLLLAGCQTLGLGSDEPEFSPTDRRTSEARIDDRAIEQYGVTRITERFGERVQVSVTSFNHAVLLTGAVPDADTRAEVGKVVAEAAGVRGVTNETEIAGVPSRNARASDADIAAKVSARFRDAGKFDPAHVRVVTQTGVVYLMGLVTEKEAEDAVEIARTTDGVRKVVKIFEYCKPTDAACLPSGAPR
jgi:osmotically-inducible protein OsmY